MNSREKRMIALDGAEISGIVIAAGLVLAWFVHRGLSRTDPGDAPRSVAGDFAISPPGKGLRYTRILGQRCSVCGERIEQARAADTCLDCDLPYHLACEEDHRCHQEWVAEEE
jgi:hypothetical protein